MLPSGYEVIDKKKFPIIFLGLQENPMPGSGNPATGCNGNE